MVVQKDQRAKALLKSVDADLEAAIQAIRDAFSSEVAKRVKTTVALGEPVIELTDVSKKYKLGHERVQALDKVSVSIREGEFVALTGPSGSGKSTLLQLMGGLDKPSDGTVVVNQRNISKLSDRQLSIFRNQTIGFVFQFFYLQPFLKTKTNLEVPGMFARTKRTERLSRVEELAVAVGLTERLEHLPKELSGGQMQRAAIARALLNHPKVLLADEPTGNLDSTNSRAIIELFNEVRAKFGTTVVIVTHDKDIARMADREIQLLDGKVVAA